jgi:hydrogenase nickel incorporation protein HypA/HybF
MIGGAPSLHYLASAAAFATISRFTCETPTSFSGTQMHELSIAINLVEIAGEEARKAGATKVLKVHLQIGALSGVVPGALEFVFDVASRDTLVQGASLVIDPVPVSVYCDACRRIVEIRDISDMACPVCGLPSADIRGGRELDLLAIEIEEPVAAESYPTSPRGYPLTAGEQP